MMKGGEGGQVNNYFSEGIDSKDNTSQYKIKEGFSQPKMKSLVEVGRYTQAVKTGNKDKHPHFLDNGISNNNSYSDRVGNLLRKIDGERNKLSGSMMNVAGVTSPNGRKSLKQTMHGMSQSSVSSTGIRLKSIEMSSMMIGEDDRDNQGDSKIGRKQFQVFNRTTKMQSDSAGIKGGDNSIMRSSQQHLRKIATVGAASGLRNYFGNKSQSQQVNSQSQIRLPTGSDASTTTRRIIGNLGENDEKLPIQSQYSLQVKQINETAQIIQSDDQFEQFEFNNNNASNMNNNIINNSSNLDIPANTINGTSSQITQNPTKLRNNYTSSDSRFEVISNLKTKCIYQERIIQELQTEIASVDEFKLVMSAQINRQNEDMRQYGEKRIMLLQGQLKKQQRYIRRLNILLSTARKSLSEVLEVTRLLVDGVNKSANGEAFLNQMQISSTLNQIQQIQNANNQEGNINNNGSDGNTYQAQSNRQVSINTNRKISQDLTSEKPKLIRKSENNPGNNEITSKTISKEDSKYLNDANSPQDQQNQHKKTEKDIPQILSYMTQQQALKKVYEALMEVDDKQRFVNNFNELYKKVSEFEANSEEFKKLFVVQKHRGGSMKVKFLHPIRVIFENFPNCFPVPTLFSILDPAQKQALLVRIFALMGVLKATQRSFSRIRAFSLFSHNPLFFEDTEQHQGNITIPTLLLENKQQFEEFLQPRGYARMLSLDFKKIMATDVSLGLILDRLLNFFGQLNMKGENTTEIAELMHSIRQGCEDLICLGIVAPNEQGNLTSQKIALISEKKPLQIPSNELEWVDYDKSMDMHVEFNEKRMTLNILFDELSQVVGTNKGIKECHDIIQKIQGVLGSLSVIFETKQNQIKLKDIEIAYLRNLVSLLKQEEIFAQEFISSMQSSINEFLTPVNTKVSTIVGAFNSLFEGQKIIDATSRKTYTNTFKRNTKEMLELLKRILTNSCPTNRINILTLQQQFDQRVKQVSQRNQQLNPSKQRNFYG